MKYIWICDHHLLILINLVCIPNSPLCPKFYLERADGAQYGKQMCPLGQLQHSALTEIHHQPISAFSTILSKASNFHIHQGK